MTWTEEEINVIRARLKDPTGFVNMAKRMLSIEKKAPPLVCWQCRDKLKGALVCDRTDDVKAWQGRSCGLCGFPVGPPLPYRPGPSNIVIRIR